MLDRDQLLETLPRLRRYARLLCGEPASADDLVQETLVRGWQKRTLFRAGSDLRGWLFAIMHNLHVSQWRAVRNDPVVAASLSVQSTDAMVPSDGSFRMSSDPSGMDTLIDLERGLAALTPEHREVIWLVSVEDLPYAQVAELLGLPIGTVMSRLSRARAQLRAWMDRATPLDGAAHSAGLQVARPALRVAK